MLRAGHPEIASLNIGMPEFFHAVDRELARTPVEDWKTYLRWQLLDAYAPYLSKAFVDEDFRMTAALTGAEELQAAVAARPACRGRGARIRDRRALRGAEISARREAGGDRDRRAHARRAARRPVDALLDDARDARGGGGEARPHAAAHRISGPMARLQRARDRPRSVRAQRHARERVRVRRVSSQRSASRSIAASGT